MTDTTRHDTNENARQATEFKASTGPPESMTWCCPRTTTMAGRMLISP